MSNLLQKVLCGSLLVWASLPPESDAAPSAVPEAVPLEALIVGGGPDENSNAAQIEGHVRFVTHLLPAAAKRRVLFADGKPENASVSYADTGAAADAQRALAVLLQQNGPDEPLLLRKPELGTPTDGPSSRDAIHRAITDLLPKAGGKPAAPLLLYFAGHGGPNEDKKEEDTEYNLWNHKPLAVHDLSMEIARLPPDTPVVLVMAQCYSGAFANLLFRKGDPHGELAPQDLAGFFSARNDREASGCGWNTGSADYQDFSSYFFGALCGHDRFGHPVTGTDFNRDGHITLHEAFCYALSHDESFDTPTCTSYLFLRRFVGLPDAKIYGMPYAEAWQAATSAQRAALDALSQKLGLGGENRALAAWDRLMFQDPQGTPAELASYREATDRLSTMRQAALESLFQRWPVLRWKNEKAGYSQAMDGAAKELAGNKSLSSDLREAGDASDRADAAMEEEEARLMRFIDLYAGVVLAKHLRENGEKAVKANFARLWAAEQQSLPLGEAPAAR